MIAGNKISEDTVLIWSAEDATKLREKHHIMGSYIGSLPTQPRQNGYLGLPMRLLPEETTLLLEKGLLELKIYEDPLSSIEGLGAMYDQIKKKQQEQQLKDYLAQKANDAQPVSFSPLVSVHTSDPVSLKKDSKTTSWNWPCDDKQKLKYRVFSDLWHKGYYITSGLKYGGDYLVYTNNPLVVHSQFIAKIYSWSEDISPMSLIQDGRLGGKVKKNILLCTLKADDSVQYISLYWSGIS